MLNDVIRQRFSLFLPKHLGSQANDMGTSGNNVVSQRSLTLRAPMSWSRCRCPCRSPASPLSAIPGTTRPGSTHTARSLYVTYDSRIATPSISSQDPNSRPRVATTESEPRLGALDSLRLVIWLKKGLNL